MTKLIAPEIIEAMQALGFIVTENPFAVEFKHPEERTCYVSYSGSQIECWHYNDDEFHDRYQLTMRAELKTFPALSEWLMLMHVGQIISLPIVLKLISRQIKPESLFENMATMISENNKAFKLLMQ